jgi:hypothetical protein
MQFTKTDDPIKGVGFVAINFAYLEDTLDELVKLSCQMFVAPNGLDRWKFRDKAEWLKKQFRAAFKTCKYPYSDEEKARVDHVLDACRAVATERNEIVHRPIFGGKKGGALQKEASGKMRPLDITLIFRLAERVDALNGEVWELRYILGRLSDSRRASG